MLKVMKLYHEYFYVYVVWTLQEEIVTDLNGSLWLKS